jgi:hypothetical protein
MHKIDDLLISLLSSSSFFSYCGEWWEICVMSGVRIGEWGDGN